MRRDTRPDADRPTEPRCARSPARIEHLSIAADERFDEHVCPACGQQVQQCDEDRSDHSGFIGETGAVRPAGRFGPVKWFTVALLSIFAAALFIGGRGESSVPVSEPDTAPPSADNTPDEGPTADTTVGSGDDELGSDTDDRADTDDRIVSDVRIEITRRTLLPLIGRHRLAYVSPEGIVIVDPAVEEGPVSLVMPEQATMDVLLPGFDSFSTLHEQGHTYGFKRDPESNAQRVFVLFTQGEVIAGEKSSFALALGDAEAVDHLYVGNSSGLFMSRLAVPAGAELLAVPSVGVLVVSSTGETFVATQGGFAHYSDWPVIAANAAHHVEIRCSEPLSCTPLLVDRLSGAVMDLPVELAAGSGEISISPDGSHLLLLDPRTGQSAPVRLYDVAAAELSPLAAEIGNTLAWAPDSTVAAWLEPATTDPLLRVFDLATKEILSVDLTSLGAPVRSGDALLLLPP